MGRSDRMDRHAILYWTSSPGGLHLSDGFPSPSRCAYYGLQKVVGGRHGAFHRLQIVNLDMEERPAAQPPRRICLKRIVYLGSFVPGTRGSSLYLQAGLQHKKCRNSRLPK